MPPRTGLARVKTVVVASDTALAVQIIGEESSRGNSMIKKSASSLDFKRTWPLTLSMLLVGSSVGVVAPAMPFVRNNLGLTAAEYGMVVSAFALAKMSGNIPSAVLVERHGRKVR